MSNQTIPVAIIPAHTHEVTGIAWRPGGRGMATCSSDCTVKVWDWPSREVPNWKVNTSPYRVLKHPEAVTGIAWGQGGGRRSGAIFTTCHDSKVRVWDAHRSEMEACLDGHTRASTCLELSADESTLVSGSKDGTIRVWDVDAFILK